MKKIKTFDQFVNESKILGENEEYTESDLIEAEEKHRKAKRKLDSMGQKPTLSFLSARRNPHFLNGGWDQREYEKRKNDLNKSDQDLKKIKKYLNSGK